MLKKIRSPGLRSLRSTLMPWPLAMALDVRGRSTSSMSLKAYLTSPLQSKPLLGLLPPQRYGVPSTLTARLSTSLLCCGDMAAATGSGLLERALRLELCWTWLLLTFLCGRTAVELEVYPEKPLGNRCSRLVAWAASGNNRQMVSHVLKKGRIGRALGGLARNFITAF
ncbi:hypothetical protein D3C79_755500 [compost metagenome]